MDKAKEYFDLAISENYKNPDNYFNLGNVLLNQGKFENAHANFNEAIERDKSNAKFHHAKGLAFQAEAEHINRNCDPSPEAEEIEVSLISQAIAAFNEALKYSKTFISSMFHLGLMYRRTQRFHEALTQFSNVQNYLADDKTIYI